MRLVKIVLRVVGAAVFVAAQLWDLWTSGAFDTLAEALEGLS